MSFNVGLTGSVTGNDGGGDQGFCFGSPITMPQAGIIQSISLHISSGATGNIILLLYDNSGTSPSGAPKVLLAKTAVTACVNGWNTLNTLTNPTLTNGSTYFLMCIPDGGEAPDYGGTGTNSSINNSIKDAGGDTISSPPNPFVSGGFYGSPFNLYLMYATFNPVPLNTMTVLLSGIP